MNREKIEKIQLHLKEHWAAYALAFFTGLMMIVPQVMFRVEAGKQYRGFNMFETDAEYYYMARINDARQGDFMLSNPLTRDGKDFPYLQPPLPEIIMGAIGRILFLDVPGILIFFRITATAGIFLLIYFFIHSLTNGKKLPALLAPAIVLLGSNLISYPGQLIHLFRGTLVETEFLGYSRPVNPQISSLFFFAFVLSFWKMTQSFSRKYFWLSMVLFGLAFYVYPYTWSFELVWMGIFGIFLLWRKQREEFKKVVLVALGGVIISIPYFINTWFVIHHPSYATVMSTYGVVDSHKLVFSSVLCALFVMLIGLRVFDRENSINYFLFLLGTVITGFIVINQQVITGTVLYYGHYHWYFHKPLLAIFASILLFTLLRRLPWQRWVQGVVFGVSLGLLVINAYAVQTVSYRVYFQNYITYQKYGDVIEWLKNNTRPNDTVYVPGSFYNPAEIPFPDLDIRPSRMLARFIFSYTPLNIYFYTDQGYFLPPYPDYSYYNLQLVLKAQGVAPAKAEDYLRSNPVIFRDIYLAYFKVSGRPYRSLSSNDLTPERVQAALAGYDVIYSQDWQSVLTKYPLEYIVWDRDDLPNWPWDKLAQSSSWLEKKYEKDGIVIYFIHPKNG